MNDILQNSSPLKIRIFSSDQLIPLSLRNKYPDFQFMGAIKPGDIITALDEKINILAVIDRSKENPHLALSMGEITDGLRCGLKIYGAAELGAIRAKECREMGMIGTGEIFEHLQESFTFHEDWYYEAHDGFSYIDLFFALKKMPSLPSDLKKNILASYEATHYKERTFEKLCLTEELKLLFSEKPASQKMIDAEILLKKIQDDVDSIKKTNTLIWQKQEKQLSNSECELKWKSIR